MAGPVPLPGDFLERMAALLGEEYAAFLASYAEPPTHGLRVNTLKLSSEAFRALSPWPLKPVPWCASGFLLPPDHNAGRHPFHAAGLYYLQEPSAMAVAEALGAQPGERILDLCAAPGGKATHLAAQMQGRGVLVANEVLRGRARVLAGNLERCGATNAIVTQETPERLAARWSGCFDRVLVDAPCSGEGMFRRSEAARGEWSASHVAGCALRQRAILDQAAELVRPGGWLAYATCTFAPEENEATVAEFLRSHPAFEVAGAPALPGLSPGRPEWAGGGPSPPGLERTARLWPHRGPGEGHFVALLRRRGDEAPAPWRQPSLKPPAEHLRAYEAFCHESLWRLPEADLLFGSALYRLPEGAPDLAGVRVVRPGWWLGTVRKGRFEPSHALALGLRLEEARRVLALSPDDERTARYLRGEVLRAPGEAGWLLVAVAGYPLGWGKRVGDAVKNHYPRALRG